MVDNIDAIVERIGNSANPMDQADREIVRYWNDRVNANPSCKRTRHIRKAIIAEVVNDRSTGG